MAEEERKGTLGNMESDSNSMESESNEEKSPPSTKKLKSATIKLKTEALRRLKMAEDGNYEDYETLNDPATAFAHGGETSTEKTDSDIQENEGVFPSGKSELSESTDVQEKNTALQNATDDAPNQAEIENINASSEEEAVKETVASNSNSSSVIQKATESTIDNNDANNVGKPSPSVQKLLEKQNLVKQSGEKTSNNDDAVISNSLEFEGDQLNDTEKTTVDNSQETSQEEDTVRNSITQEVDQPEMGEKLQNENSVAPEINSQETEEVKVDETENKESRNDGVTDDTAQESSNTQETEATEVEEPKNREPTNDGVSDGTAQEFSNRQETEAEKVEEPKNKESRNDAVSDGTAQESSNRQETEAEKFEEPKNKESRNDGVSDGTAQESSNRQETEAEKVEEPKNKESRNDGISDGTAQESSNRQETEAEKVEEPKNKESRNDAVTDDTTQESSNDDPNKTEETNNSVNDAKSSNQPKLRKAVVCTVDGSYENDELLSKGICTGDVPVDLLTLHHSFGFECRKRSNLHLISSEHLLFSAGNTFQILNVETKEQVNIRTISGGGIGAIAVHPSRSYFAISEKGFKPDIIIYEFPSLKICRVLREGTEAAYSNLDFSPSGEKLASVGSYPDYMMTIWDWKKEKIILRSKAFSQDVYKVAFSPEDEGHLCSSGTGHIKFWTMANTFTGLKLQGDLGRFGTTELSDISGFVELPDGKVLSGTEWGNMLLWDGGLIKAELKRKEKKTCHQGNIEQFFLDEGELITIGIDGCVKVWDFESIDTADPQDESKIFEIEPMSELKVGADVKLVSMMKSVDDEHSFMWYAQDANGAIWSLDLSFSHTSQSPVELFSYHSGGVSAISMSPIFHVAATTGQDGTVRLYDYFAKTALCQKKFNTSGCSVLWIPKVVDAACSSILVGFSDGVVRHLTVTKNNERTGKKRNLPAISLHLTQVFKPHLKAVTCLTIDVQGKILATGSEDGTVFFFSIANTFKPIGFVEIGSEVVSLDWSSFAMGNKLLVAGKDGTIMEFAYPQPSKFDTSKSFQLPTKELLLNRFQFKTVKDDLLRAEEEEEKMKEAVEKQRKEQAEREQRKAQGIEEPEEEEDGGEEEEEQEGEDDEEEGEEVVEPIRHEQGNVLKGFYRRTGSDKFVLTMDGWDAGYFYECKFPSKPKPKTEGEQLFGVNNEDDEEELVNAIKIPDIYDVPITASCFSKNGDYLALGLQNGALRIQNMKSSTLENLLYYWYMNVHDNQNGTISDISISFDGKFLMCVGADGNIFAFSFIDEENLKEYEKSRAELQAETIEGMPVDDIDDPKSYSIELEKQKAENDKKMRLAEEKKQQVKNTINKLRRDFRKLKSKNGELPSYLQLPPQEFIIDPQIKVDIENETQEKIKLVELETWWDSERHNIALKKLQKKYKDCIECDRIVLHSFLSGHEVCSFRSSVLSKEFYELVEENKRTMSFKEAANTGGGPNSRKVSLTKGRRAMSLQGATADGFDKSKIESIQEQQPKLDSKVAKMIEKVEQRRQKRLKRQKEWEELYRSKPDENYEDPEDVSSIKHAQLTIGDFKLKTAHDYVVPENERINTEKKQAQLFDLKEQIHDLKKEFNDRLLGLRDQKISTVETIKSLTKELTVVQSKLPERCHVTLPEVPEMKPDELPEKNLEYTVEKLIEFRKNVLGLDTTKIDEPAVAGQQPGHNIEPHSKTASTRATNGPRLRSTSMVSTFSSSVPPSSSSAQCDTPDIMEEPGENEDEKSAFQLAIEREEEIRLTYERNELLKKIQEHLIYFDAELRLLRHDKIHLDIKLKNAELKQITLFEEYVLLKDFEKRENFLANKLMVKLEEKDEMQDKVDECRDVLTAKKEEFEKLQEREKTLMQALTSAIGDNNKFEAFLIKVFKKKIKRPKKKTAEEGSSGEESDDWESDGGYDDSDDEVDSDEDELDDGMCPAGCDNAIFDQICLLRDRRLDFEDLLFETKKACDNMKKDLDTLVKKVKVIDNALKSAGADLETFQLEKQQKLNELDVVVTLKLDQIQYVVNNALPQDLSKCLVFKRCFLERLQRRIKELEREKITEKQSYKGRRQQHVQMHRDKKAMQTKNKELEERVQQIQLLKFGRLVDLEKLETVSVNRVAEELKEKLREQESRSTKEILDLERIIDKHQSELTELVRENTKRLDTYTVLLQENCNLGQQLDSRQKNLGADFQGTGKAELEEQDRLVQLVQLQSQEIEALKDEINVLSRKGGQILPPPRSTLPRNHGLTR